MTRTRSRIAAGMTALTVVAGMVVAAAAHGATPPRPAPAPLPAPASPRVRRGSATPTSPLAGNGGYDAEHYDLRLAYDPGSGVLSGSAVMRRTATQNLSRFDLDLAGLTVSSREGRRADRGVLPHAGRSWWSPPPGGCGRDARSPSWSRYAGVPAAVTDTDGSTRGVDPHAGRRLRGRRAGGRHVVVPVQQRALGQGDVRPADDGAEGNLGVGQRCSEVERQQRRQDDVLVAAAAAHLDLPGDLDVGQVRPPHRPDQARAAGLPRGRPGGQGHAVDDPAAHRGGDRLGDEGSSGPTRSPRPAAIVDDAATVGYALETATKPMYDRAPDLPTVVHELAHQWFGDSVTPRSWRDIWLNEGFATYAEWLWAEQHGGPTAARRAPPAARACTRRPTRSGRRRRPTPAAPRRSSTRRSTSAARWPWRPCASASVTGRSARLLRTWAAEHRYGVVSTADFLRCAEHVSGRQLDGFFDAWLYQPRRPAGV